MKWLWRGSIFGVCFSMKFCFMICVLCCTAIALYCKLMVNRGKSLTFAWPVEQLKKKNVQVFFFNLHSNFQIPLVIVRMFAHVILLLNRKVAILVLLVYIITVNFYWATIHSILWEWQFYILVINSIECMHFIHIKKFHCRIAWCIYYIKVHPSLYGFSTVLLVYLKLS